MEINGLNGENRGWQWKVGGFFGTASELFGHQPLFVGVLTPFVSRAQSPSSSMYLGASNMDKKLFIVLSRMGTRWTLMVAMTRRVLRLSDEFHSFLSCRAPVTNIACAIVGLILKL